MNVVSKVFIITFLPFLSFSQWELHTIDKAISYRSIDTDGKGCIWAGGSSNTISMSCDNGRTWTSMKVGTENKLDFRGIAVLNENEIVAMSAGLGSEGAAKVYKTTDKGKTWEKVFSSSEEAVFMDGIKFFNEKEGIIYGDPLGSKFFVMKTSDGGLTWKNVSERLPDILDGEASYAASNTNINIFKNTVWIATQSRIFKSNDKGETWEAELTPFKSGKTAGIFGLYLNRKYGIAVGGDYIKENSQYENLYYKKPKSKKWSRVGVCKPFGLKEAVLPLSQNLFLIIGTSGTSQLSLVGGTCAAIDSQSFHTGICDDQHCYAIGGKGNFGIWVK